MLIEVKRPKKPERTLLVALECPGQTSWDTRDSLRELEQLVESAGGEVVGSAVQKLPRPTAPYYIGKGKAEELSVHARAEALTTVVFDEELSPAQSRNLEKMFGIKVIDRTQLILDIFAQRAQTREGKLQIELAQLQYLLPRLTRMWTHLSRQSGGIGTRGPGETQLEVDRRRVQERIGRLIRDLEAVRKNRAVQRAGRQRHEWPLVALVGYTNAGKSTLLNRLTQSEVYAADQLFATLDPTTRRMTLPNRQSVLLSDTVGFLQKLPHHLVESFKATLEEVVQADLLLHVVDLSHPQYEGQIRAVNEVLGQLGALQKPGVLVFNKIDLLPTPALQERALEFFDGSVTVSAATGEGMEGLLHEIERRVRHCRVEVELRIPNHDTAAVAEIYRCGQVHSIRYEGDDALVKASVPPPVENRFRRYRSAKKKR